MYKFRVIMEYEEIFFFFWTFINPQELLEVTTKFSLNRANYQVAVSVSDTMLIREITIFRSHLLTSYTELNRRIALSFDGDKRFISKNSVDKTLTWGHKDVTLNEKIMYCVLYSITIYTISTCNSMRCAKEF
jgi:hypothetical protein